MDVLLIFMATLDFVVAVLVLFVAFCLFWHRPSPTSQTDYVQKCAAQVLLIMSISQLVLSLITALLALVLIVLASLKGHDTICHVVLSICLICVNGFQVRDNQIFLNRS